MGRDGEAVYTLERGSRASFTLAYHMYRDYFPLLALDDIQEGFRWPRRPSSEKEEKFASLRLRWPHRRRRTERMAVPISQAWTVASVRDEAEV